MTAWRETRRAARVEGEPNWPTLPLVVRPPGLTHACVQARATAAGQLQPPVTVELWGTSLSPAAVTSDWRLLGAVVLDEGQPGAFFGADDLVHLYPYRWLRLVPAGGPDPCALVVVIDGDVPESR